MREAGGLIHAEFLKLRRSFLIPVHVLIPIAGSVLFLLYYRVSNWNEIAQVAGFFEVVGIAYPFIIGIVCAKAVELEEENHFQTFLGVYMKKRYAFLFKWMVMQILSLGAVLVLTVIFAIGFRVWLGNTSMGMGVYLNIALILWAGSIPLYLEHLYLNLRFSKTVSIGIGAAQLLLSALMLTGLGDGRWQMFPSTWSARGSQTFLVFCTQKETAPLLSIEMRNWLICGILITTLLYVIIITWFHYYEGRQYND